MRWEREMVVILCVSLAVCTTNVDVHSVGRGVSMLIAYQTATDNNSQGTTELNVVWGMTIPPTFQAAFKPYIFTVGISEDSSVKSLGKC